MADEVASLLVRITADGSQAVGVLNGIQATVGTLADSNATTMSKIAASGALASKVGMTITKTVGVATVAGLTASAKAAGQLNKELANIGTLSVPNEKLKQYKGQIQDIAIATGKSTSDISEGTYQVVSAFGDAADTMEKVEINAKAAKAGLATTADSINLTSAVTKAYGDTSAAAVQKVADLAFKTVELGQTTFPELASSMQQVTSLSKELGVSQEELFASYATLTGVTGGAAEVQTQMKAIYTALLKPSENMTKAIKKQGYESGYSMIKTLGFAGTLDALKKATNGSEEEMLGLFNNVRAMPAVMALTGAQYDTFNTKLEKMKNAAGAASDAFDVQTEGIAKTGFTLEQAKIKMEVAAQRFGESAAPIIGDFADVVDKASDALANMSDSERQAIIHGGVLTTKIGLGLAVLGKATTLGTQIYGTISAISPALAGAVVPLTAFAGAGVIASVALEKMLNYSDGMNKQADAIGKASDELIKYNDLANEVKELRLVINNPESSAEQVETARTRLHEIADMLSDEYNLTIKADTTELESAISQLQQKDRSEIIQKAGNLINKATKGADNYSRSVSEASNWEKDIEQLERMESTYSDLQASANTYREAFDSGFTSQSRYMSQMNDLYQKAKDTGIEFEYIGYTLEDYDVDNLISTINSSLDNTRSTLNGLRFDVDYAKSEMDEFKQSTEKASTYLTKVLASDVQSGNAFGSDTDIEMLTQLGEAMTKAGLSTQETAADFAAAKEGYNDFAKAIAEGDIQKISKNFIDYSKSIGESSENIAVGATLIQNGFKTIDAAASAGKLSVISEQANELAHSLGLIAENEHIEINADGKVTIKVDDKEVQNYKAPDKDGNAIYHPDGSEVDRWTPPEKQGKVIYNAVMPDSFKNTNYGKFGVSVFPQATGTQNFPGGLAKVNDQKGITDPRELIIDRGRAFIPEGKDVILPLSKGAKVYTAAQTKAIMSGAGIPHYAEGKNNSDAFTKARDDWGHYTKTHAVTTAQELEKYLEFQEKYKQNSKDIWDIEEQVFSLRQKQFSEQTKASEAWLSHESKYNGLAVTEQLDAIDRIRKSVVAAYEAGLISHKEYLDTISSYDEKYIDKRKEQIAEMFDISKGYISDRTFFNNWDEYGDDPIEAYKRVQSDRLNELRAGELTQKEYDEYMKELGSDMYSERREQSERWLDESRCYFNMNAEDYAKGIDRMKKYTQEYYDNGLINLREYNEAMTELNHMAWDEAESAYEEMLSNQSKYISEMRDKFSKQEQELRDSWTVADRKTDMATVQKQLDLYSGAVTDRGQQKYKELQEQMKQLQRDEELYNLQVANNATIESLEAEYTKLEADKKAVLAGIAQTNIDVSGIVGTLTSNLDGMGGSIINLLQTLINTVNNKEFSGPDQSSTQNFYDNRTITTMQPIALPGYVGGLH